MTARILVVDDIPNNVKLLEIKLKSEYYEVLVAYSGAEAIEITKKEQPDLVLLDVMMPIMNGFEVCQLLKSSYETAHIPIIIITALTDLDYKLQGLRCGADDFLIKPVNDIALFARVRSLVRLKIVTDELRLRCQTNIQMVGPVQNEIMTYISQITAAKILIIDDDQGQCDQIKAKLQKHFADVSTANTAEAAFDLIRKNDFDVIITDVELSNTPSLRICSQLRSEPTTRFTPILMLVEDEENMELFSKGMEIGVNDYLTIPPNESEMVSRLNTQIRRKRYQEALRQIMQSNIKLSIIDPLTEVYNRRYFDLYLENTLKEISKNNTRTFSIAMIDVDYFKEVNDTYGHLAGDELLKQLAVIIKNNLRVSDLVARIGGEEFIIFFPDTKLKEATEIAVRLCNLISQYTFNVSSNTILTKTVSIGVALCHEEETSKTLIERVDKCLYQAKNTGKNKVITETDIN